MVLPLIGAGLSAATGIIGALSQQAAARDALGLGYANLNFQKQNAAQQFDLATAERPDAYGNTTRYNPITKKWELDMTDQQQAIIDAFQTEQAKTLGEDAERARNLRRTQEQRAGEAEPLYEQAVSEYMYSPNRPDVSSAEEVGQAMNAAASARSEANRARAQQVQTQAIRQGQGADLQKILAGGDRVSADAMVQDILRAQQAGEQRHAGNVVSWENLFKPRIDMFRSVMDDIGASQRIDPDSPNRMDQTMKSVQAAIQSALSGASSGIGNAYGNLASLTANTGLDLSGVANVLSKIGQGGTGPTTFTGTETNPYYPATPAQSERIEPGPRNPDYLGY